MRCSIVLCTYNGCRFLGPQLDSYARQTLPPDELVVCDDSSRDDTVTCVEAFAKTASFPVHIHVNERNLGLWRNFEKAIGLASGDIIFMSDQDDVWHPWKLRRMRDVFVAEPGVGFVVGNAQVVDENLRSKGHTLWEVYGLSQRLQDDMDRGRAFAALLRNNTLTGATMAFRSNLRRYMLPLPPGWAYDSWFAAVLAAFTRCRLVREPVNLYRQHANQAVGAFGTSTRVKAAAGMTRQTYAENAQAFKSLQQRMLQFQSELLDRAFLTLIEEKIEFFQVRSRLNQARILRLPSVLAHLARGRYHRYASGWKSVAKDCFTP